MYSDEDWKAALSSEIFRNYLSGEMRKMANSMANPISDPQPDLVKLENAFKELEIKIKASTKLTQAFRRLQETFKTNADYTQKVDPAFVKGVLALDLTNGSDDLIVEEDSE